MGRTDGQNSIGISNGSGEQINPSTEDKQDDIITGLYADYLIEVASGNVAGQTPVTVIGNNPNMQADTQEHIWDQGGLLTYLTSDTQLYASSTNASDTTVTLSVPGLDDTYAEVTRTVTLNGQNQVALSGDMFRVFDATVTGNTEPLGDIYISETDSLTGGVPDTASKIKQKIRQGKNSAQCAFYTVPAGKSLYFTGITYVAPKGVDIDFISRFRLFGGLFFSNAEFNLYQSIHRADIKGQTIPEKTDLDFIGIASNAGSSATISLTFILIDN